MPAEERKDDPSPKLARTRGIDSGFLSSQQTPEKTSWMPWIVAAAVVVVGLGILILVGGHGSQNSQAGGAGMAPADPYAASLPISGLQMSEATSFSGAKVTYIDGQIANNGNRTLTAITVQVGFHSDVGQYALRVALPLSLIRTRQPYVDTATGFGRPHRTGPDPRFSLDFRYRTARLERAISGDPGN